MRKLSTWMRYKENEGDKVFRWYETKGGNIASIVEGYFPNEANLRLTTKRKAIEIRGHKSIMLSRSDNELIRMINMHKKRSRM